MILTHTFAGLSVTFAVQRFWKDLTHAQEKLIWVTGITASIIPDLDFLLMPITGTGFHHEQITHTPTFYLFIGLVFAVMLLILERKYEKDVIFIERLLVIFLANTFLHVLLDIFVGRIMLFWPICSEAIQIFSITHEKWLSEYIESPALIPEIISLILGSFVLFKVKQNSARKIIYATFSFWMTVTIGMTVLFFG